RSASSHSLRGYGRPPSGSSGDRLRRNGYRSTGDPGPGGFTGRFRQCGGAPDRLGAPGTGPADPFAALSPLTRTPELTHSRTGQAVLAAPIRHVFSRDRSVGLDWHPSRRKPYRLRQWTGSPGLSPWTVPFHPLRPHYSNPAVV